MTLGNPLNPIPPPLPPDFKLMETNFKYYHKITLEIPKNLSYHMIFTCRLTFLPAAAPALAAASSTYP